uniref:ULP_PROTEASE domain-containing protein n=2 Tax=Macrostomum lignano TaxID=282301 RepID=A0A1I8J9M7_9PLAT
MYFSKFPHLILIENALSRVINRTEMASSRDTSSSSSASDRPLESTNFAIEIEPTSIQFSSAIHASAHDDTLQVRRFTPASRGLEPFHFLSSTKFAVLQAVEMRFDSSENKSIRAQLKFNIRMVRIKEAAVINAEDKWIACGLELLSDLRDFELWWLQQFSELERKIDAYNSNGSGWIVEQINYFDLCSALTDRIRYYRGRCANFSLPNQLAVKKAIINPPSDGNNCFLFACLAYLHIRDPGVMKSCHRLTTYSRWLDEIDLSGIALPVAISDLDVIEEKNSEICFTVFSWEDDEAYVIRQPLPGICASRKVIPLLLLRNSSSDDADDDDGGDENCGTGHWCAVSNLDRLLNSKKGLRNRK